MKPNVRFWYDLAERFHAIHKEPGSPGLIVQFSGRLSGHTDWQFHPLDPDADQFALLAQLAVRGLGHDGMNAVAVWLDHMTTHAVAFRKDPLTTDRGALWDVAGASARYCQQLGIEAELGRHRPKATTAQSFPRRATWLRDQLATRGETAHRFGTVNKIDPRNVKRLLAGQGVRGDVLERLALALDCHINDIPAD